MEYQGLSFLAYKVLGLKWDEVGNAFEENRCNPQLIEIVEKLGDNASSNYADLQVIKIDLDDILNSFLVNFDGMERIEKNYNDEYNCTPILKYV